MDKKSQKSCYPAPFSLRLTSEEREELKSLAKGRPLGQFIKDAIFSKKLRPPSYRKLHFADRQLLVKLLSVLGQSRIASNLNQLAKAAHSGSLPVNEEMVKSLTEAVEAVRWMRESLIEGMGLKSQSQHSGGQDDDA